MQFNYHHNVTESVSKVTFINPEKIIIHSWKLLDAIFQKLGAMQCGDASYLFPSFVSSKVIEEILRNTCFMCGGLMQDSIALQNTLVSFNDFGNDTGNRGTTQSRIGSSIQVNVRKCSQCGHSHT